MTLVIYACRIGHELETFVYDGVLPLDYVINALATMPSVYSWRLFR